MLQIECTVQSVASEINGTLWPGCGYPTKDPNDHTLSRGSEVATRNDKWGPGRRKGKWKGLLRRVQALYKSRARVRLGHFSRRGKTSVNPCSAVSLKTRCKAGRDNKHHYLYAAICQRAGRAAPAQGLACTLGESGWASSPVHTSSSRGDIDALVNGVPPRKPALRILFTVASSYGFLRCVDKMIGRRFDDQTYLLQHELHMWRSEYNRDGCTDSATLMLTCAGAGRRTYMLPHARASSRRGYNPGGSCGGGPLYGNPVRSLALAGSALLFGRRRFGDFSGEGVGRSATSRVSVRCSGGIHMGPDQRCRTYGERCAG
ncbi:hypothetical protein EVAR_19788_1 [Eumeta japonica]|uniref:Uncharacterized protein n=1 Tax=Eumeta variegata TaxID=151549 RepID=A0A4C1URZ3_EUMVA|nr:hypothetical protein EVAR_19788_1 [Eumeta japonica]